jgi:hypothetical protein
MLYATVSDRIDRQLMNTGRTDGRTLCAIILYEFSYVHFPEYYTDLEPIPDVHR